MSTTIVLNHQPGGIRHTSPICRQGPQNFHSIAERSSGTGGGEKTAFHGEKCGNHRKLLCVKLQGLSGISAKKMKEGGEMKYAFRGHKRVGMAIGRLKMVEGGSQKLEANPPIVKEAERMTQGVHHPKSKHPGDTASQTV